MTSNYADARYEVLNMGNGMTKMVAGKAVTNSEATRSATLREAAFAVCWYCRTGSKNGHNPIPEKTPERWQHLFWIGNGSNPCAAGEIWELLNKEQS